MPRCSLCRSSVFSVTKQSSRGLLRRPEASRVTATLRGMLVTIRRRYGSAELRATDSSVTYLVGTPKGRHTRYEAALAEKP